MDINEIIIEEVKKYECLYNLALKDYKNVQKKTEIWNRIGNIVNLTGDACRKRWRGLRDTYKRYKRAAQLASGSGARTPRKKWKYMKTLQFLDIYKDARPTIGSVQNDEIDLECVFDCFSASLSEEPTTNTDESLAELIEERPRKYSKKHADDEITSVFKDVMKECVGTVKQLTSTSMEERDSTSILFESLAKKIHDAKLKPEVVSEIEMKVVNLIYTEIAKNSST